MNQQTRRPALKGGSQRLAAGQALHFGRRGGELRVMQGCVWLTRANDSRDYFVEAGESIQFAAGESAVIEPAHQHQDVSLRWTPRRNGLVSTLLGGYLRGAALLSGLAADGFSALARGAAAGANRAQGYLELPEAEAGD